MQCQRSLHRIEPFYSSKLFQHLDLECICLVFFFGFQLLFLSEINIYRTCISLRPIIWNMPCLATPVIQGKENPVSIPAVSMPRAPVTSLLAPISLAPRPDNSHRSLHFLIVAACNSPLFSQKPRFQLLWRSPH